MKQGRASVTVKEHSEYNIPRSHAVNPAAVDQLGQATAFRKVPIYEGRGLEAPMVGTTIHEHGSQGKHK